MRTFACARCHVRILVESIDSSRQAQSTATALRAPAPPSIEGMAVKPVIGVTPASDSRAR